jgi:hypothetical protein
VDVALEQRRADLPQRGVDMLFGELALARRLLSVFCSFSVSASNMESLF